jgi:hypothetical protein
MILLVGPGAIQAGIHHNRPRRFQGCLVGHKKSMTIEMELTPQTHHQFLVDNTFRKEDGVRLKPYLVAFSTL